ncbi:hypothetical protein FOZ63_033631, partial [Perkinsus olseni]
MGAAFPAAERCRSWRAVVWPACAQVVPSRPESVTDSSRSACGESAATKHLTPEGKRGNGAYFLQHTSWPIASVTQLAAGHGRYFGVQCMEQHCGSALNTCLMEADKSLDPEFNTDKQEIKQSQCGVMLL